MCARARWATTPFSEQRNALFLDQGRHGSAFTQAHADLVDQWLVELLGDEGDVALVAIGSYGRREPAPGSDLDLVLVHRDRRDIRDVAQRVWYPIWDAGVALDHSVKTVAEALAVAGRDLKASLGLLDGRAVAGDRVLGDELVRRGAEQWRQHARRWMRSLGDATAERHARMGDVAFLLEPDLKEGRGGLRDVTALRAAAAAVPVLPDEDLAVSSAYEVLTAARVELHRSTGKGGDRLGLQDQEPVARALAHDDADALMQAVSSAARTISWASDDAWRRIGAWLEGPSGRVVRRDQALGAGVVLRDGEVVVADDADLADDSLVLRAAAASATSGAPIARATLEQLRTGAAAPGEPWSDAARNALVELLLAGPPAVAAFETLDQFGLLVRVLPEWEPVRSRLQHNPYHRYTVDRHLLEAAAEAASLANRVERPDLLVVAAWLHDLGKGYPGDHTDAGVELAARIGARLGFAPDDVDVLAGLVRNHLLLADAATRRDVRDPATITTVAAAVTSLLELELLHALTEADSRATGETAWTTWKEGLVAELVAKVATVLRGDEPATRDEALDPELAALAEEAEGGLLVRADGERLVVIAPDRPGLFCQLAGVLTLHGLDVLAADAWSAPRGMAVDVFHVQRALGGGPDWPRFQREVSKALQGAFALEARLAERARTYEGHRRPRTRQPVPTGVTVDNDASADATVVEVRAPDAIGVLYRVTRAFLELQLDIRHAKVLTLGPEVVDSFYVVDLHGTKLDDERIGELKRSVLFELSRLAG